MSPFESRHAKDQLRITNMIFRILNRVNPSTHPTKGKLEKSAPSVQAKVHGLVNWTWAGFQPTPAHLAGHLCAVPNLINHKWSVTLCTVKSLALVNAGILAIREPLTINQITDWSIKLCSQLIDFWWEFFAFTWRQYTKVILQTFLLKLVKMLPSWTLFGYLS